MSFSDYMTTLFMPALLQTVYMLFVPTILATLIGFVIAVVLVITKSDGLKPNKSVYSVLGLVVNMVRSFPFIILLISIIPLTRLIVGTSIGETAALVPITIGSAPFIARLIESSLNDFSSSS